MFILISPPTFDTQQDYLKGAGESMRAVANLIESCNSKPTGCDKKDIITGVSNFVISGAFVIGAAFPPLGAALTVVASIGLLYSALALDHDFISKIDTTITPSTIQAAVDRALTSFTANMDIDVINSFRDFLQLDVNNYIQRIGSIGHIAKMEGANAQTYIDKQVSASKERYSLSAACGIDTCPHACSVGQRFLHVTAQLRTYG